MCGRSRPVLTPRRAERNPISDGRVRNGTRTEVQPATRRGRFMPPLSPYDASGSSAWHCAPIAFVILKACWCPSPYRFGAWRRRGSGEFHAKDRFCCGQLGSCSGAAGVWSDGLGKWCRLCGAGPDRLAGSRHSDRPRDPRFPQRPADADHHGDLPCWCWCSWWSASCASTRRPIRCPRAPRTTPCWKWRGPSFPCWCWS